MLARSEECKVAVVYHSWSFLVWFVVGVGPPSGHSHMGSKTSEDVRDVMACAANGAVMIDVRVGVWFIALSDIRL